jgi:hypothetical protein
VLLHNAAVAASDAVLLAAGWRVTSGDRGHVKRLEKAVDLLGETDDFADRLDDARMTRNEVSYAAALPAADDLAEAIAVTRDLVSAAETFVAAADESPG